MNLKKLSTEQLQSIIDSAPELAVWYTGFIGLGVYYIGKAEDNRPVQLFTKHNDLTLSPVDHQWHIAIAKDNVFGMADIKSELKSRLQIDSTRQEPQPIKTQAETLVTISNIRTWKGTPEQFGKHHEAIIHWCSGGDVEKFGVTGWKHTEKPFFHIEREYRPAKPKPKTGEVWSSDYADVVISESGHGISFTGQVIDISEDFHKVADNVKEYLRK